MFKTFERMQTATHTSSPGARPGDSLGVFNDGAAGWPERSNWARPRSHLSTGPGTGGTGPGEPVAVPPSLGTCAANRRRPVGGGDDGTTGDREESVHGARITRVRLGLEHDGWVAA